MAPDRSASPYRCGEKPSRQRGPLEQVEPVSRARVIGEDAPIPDEPRPAEDVEDGKGAVGQEGHADPQRSRLREHSVAPQAEKGDAKPSQEREPLDDG